MRSGDHIKVTGNLIAAFVFFYAFTAAAICTSGMDTNLVSSCAHGWDTRQKQGSVNPWEQDEFRRSPSRVTLTVDNCSKVRVLSIHEADRMARVKCSDSGQLLWVNMDWLGCSGTNAAIQAGFSDLRPLNGCSPKVSSPEVPGMDWLDYIMREVTHPFVRRAADFYDKINYRVESDRKAILREYSNSTHEEIRSLVEKSRAKLQKLSQISEASYGKSCDRGRFESADQERAQRTCRLLQSALTEADKFLNEPSLRPVIENYAMSLPMRMVLFHGLTDRRQRELRAKGDVALARYAVESRTTNGIPFLELHDGYVFGGSRLGTDLSGSGVDCSDFIGAVMFENNNNRTGIDVPTTATFAQIARVLEGEPGARLPDNKDLKSLASCFDPVRLRQGEVPQAGDIIISRNDGILREGHMALVSFYDREKQSVVTIEAKGKGSNVSFVQRPLFEPECSLPPDLAVGAANFPPPVRADLHVLRPKADAKAPCPLKMSF